MLVYHPEYVSNWANRDELSVNYDFATLTLAAGARLGPYEIVSPIGSGGMGEVYRAWDPRLGREVAIKVLAPEAANPDRLRRFEKEARAASSLNHPAIVTIYEVGREGTASFIAMELVDGETLRELVAAGALPIRRTLSLAAAVADGLAKAHTAGVVHRDLKPENIMVTTDGFAKILDFGLAKLTQPEAEQVQATKAPTVSAGTEPGGVMGTVGYMSPEQATGQPLDFRSDQFSFGSVLYEMATGKPPFSGRTKPETLAAIIRDEPEPIATLNTKVPPPLRWIVERCLAKEPGQRYASTEDLARDLTSVREHLSEASFSGSVSAMPTPRRWRLLAGIAVSLAAIAVGVGIGRRLAPPGSPPSFRRLTFRSGNLGMARFSPDGQTVVYSATWGASRDVYLMRLGDPESKLLYSKTDLYAVSDRGELAIMPGGWTRRPNLLARAPLAGGAPREVVEDVGWSNADWAPGGRELAIIRSVRGKNRLEFPIGKVLYESNAAICCPRVSPDGQTIAFFESNHSVRTIQADGSGAAVLSSGWQVTEGVPCWDKRGKDVWFTAGKGGESSALYRVDRSGRQREVARVPGNLELCDVSPSGRALLGHHTSTITLKWGRKAMGEAERSLSWLDWSMGVALSADGQTILFVENGEGGGADSTIYLRATDGSEAKRLGDGTALGLSPDGKWVLGTKDGGLFLLPTGPGQTRLLTGPPLEDVRGGDWSPDGTQVVFSAREKGRGARLYVQPTEAGPPRPISPEGTTLRDFGDSVSPDGRLVIGLPAPEQVTQHPEQRGEPRLYQLDGGGSHSIAGLGEGELPVGWSAGGDAVYIYKREEGRGEIQLLDIVTGQRREWRKIAPSEGGVDRLIIARDGSSYAYNSRSLLSELYLADGLK